MSVVDREALKAALDAYAVLDRRGNVEPPPQELAVRAAARSVLEGEADEWCLVHDSMRGFEVKVCEAWLLGESYLGHALTDCRMVRVVVVPIGGE